MSETKFIGRAAAAAFLAAGMVASACVSARAQDAEQPTMFGYAAPRQYLINRMIAPERPKTDSAGAPAAGQGGSGAQGGVGGQATAAAADDDNGPNNGAYQMPKHYLLNKMFDFGGGDSAPAAAAAAPAPAAKTP